MKTSVGSRSGFSLVELMVVVAIIGILATIAVPNFQRFQAKAKQSNAKVELAGIYTTEQSFYTEYQVYHGFLPGMGFMPDGISATGTPVLNATRYYASTAGPANPVTWPATLPTIASQGITYNNTFPSTSVCVAMQTADISGTAFANASYASPAAGLASGTGFLGAAAGCPASSSEAGATLDEWTIDNNKVLTNNQSGL